MKICENTYGQSGTMLLIYTVIHKLTIIDYSEKFTRWRNNFVTNYDLWHKRKPSPRRYSSRLTVCVKKA